MERENPDDIDTDLEDVIVTSKHTTVYCFDKLIEVCRQIIAQKQYRLVNDIIMDGFTASMIVQLADKIKGTDWLERNKPTMDRMLKNTPTLGLNSLVKQFWKMVKK